MPSKAITISFLLSSRRNSDSFRFGSIGQFFDGDVSEFDWVIVAGKPKEAAGAIFAGVGPIGHELGHRAQVGIQNHDCRSIRP